MNQAQAARILEVLARTEPAYDALWMEYAGALSGADVPADFPEQALNLFRADPDTAAQITRYEENLSCVQSYAPADWLSPQVVIAVLALLCVHFRIRRNQNGKWSFEAGYQPLNAEALKPVLSVVAAVIGKAGEGLVELSELLNGKSEES